MQKPHQLHVPLRFPLELSGRTDAIQIAVDVEPQQIAGIVTRPSGLRSVLEPKLDERKLSDVCIDEADGMIGWDVIVENFRKQSVLIASNTFNEAHALFYNSA